MPSHLPVRLTTGAFIFNSGYSKRGADEATAGQLHGFASGTYPPLKGVPPSKFVRLLSTGEMVLGAGMQRGEEVRRNWERAVQGVGRLNKGLPETRARLERCGGVVGYLGGGEGEIKKRGCVFCVLGVKAFVRMGIPCELFFQCLKKIQMYVVKLFISKLSARQVPCSESHTFFLPAQSQLCPDSVSKSPFESVSA